MPRTKKYQTNRERQAAYRRRCAQTTDAELINEISEPIPSVRGRRRWKAMVKAASVLLDCAASEMQDYLDQHSDQWRDSQAGESLTEMLESVQETLASLEDIAHQSYQAKSVIT